MGAQKGAFVCRMPRLRIAGSVPLIGREIQSERVKEGGEEGHQLLEHELVAERNGTRGRDGRQLGEERGDELFAFLEWLRSKIGELAAARDPFMERACAAPGKDS